jgi:hypothetical protein
MTRILMSNAAAALVRALLERTGAPREQILLEQALSVDWQSLTMVGERHELWLRVASPEAGAIAARLCDGLSEAEFAIPGQCVVDIAVLDGPVESLDGRVDVKIGALTICDYA